MNTIFYRIHFKKSSQDVEISNHLFQIITFGVITKIQIRRKFGMSTILQ